MAQDWDGDGDPREFCYRVLFKRNTVQENYTEEGVRALCGTLGIAGDLRHLEVVNRKRKNHGRDKTSVYAYFDSEDAARLLVERCDGCQPEGWSLPLMLEMKPPMTLQRLQVSLVMDDDDDDGPVTLGAAASSSGVVTAMCGGAGERADRKPPVPPPQQQQQQQQQRDGTAAALPCEVRCRSAAAQDEKDRKRTPPGVALRDAAPSDRAAVLALLQCAVAHAAACGAGAEPSEPPSEPSLLAGLEGGGGSCGAEAGCAAAALDEWMCLAGRGGSGCAVVLAVADAAADGDDAPTSNGDQGSAVAGGQVVGCCRVRRALQGSRRGAHVALVDALVAPTARRQGLGTVLVRAALRACAARGYRSAMSTPVPQCSRGALAFCDSLGFVQVGCLPGACEVFGPAAAAAAAAAVPAVMLLDAHIMHLALEGAGGPAETFAHSDVSKNEGQSAGIGEEATFEHWVISNRLTPIWDKLLELGVEDASDLAELEVSDLNELRSALKKVAQCKFDKELRRLGINI